MIREDILKSTLIRFTSSKFLDSYRTGDLYLSSLSAFWDYTDATLSFEEIIAGRLAPKYIEDAIERRNKKQMDISEGVIAQIRRDKVPYLAASFNGHIVHDVRFRLSAYKYCNTLCFTRVDAEDGTCGYLDEENAALVLNGKGIKITAEQLRKMLPAAAQSLIKSVIPVNCQLARNKTHLVQLPSPSMDAFGDMVVVIRDEKEFVKRLLAAVKRKGGHCVMGDVRYHKFEDRVDPNTMNRHSVTVITSQSDEKANLQDKSWIRQDGFYSISLLEGLKVPGEVYRRGCLDKYEIFSNQREWRICWLPDSRNYEPKILSVGSLEDIVDFVKTEDIRTYFLEKYKGYLPGIVAGRKNAFSGTDSYEEFNEYMKNIDGLGDFIIDVG